MISFGVARALMKYFYGPRFSLSSVADGGEVKGRRNAPLHRNS
jgi:hypothetical protein